MYTYNTREGGGPGAFVAMPPMMPPLFAMPTPPSFPSPLTYNPFPVEMSLRGRSTPGVNGLFFMPPPFVQAPTNLPPQLLPPPHLISPPQFFPPPQFMLPPPSLNPRISLPSSQGQERSHIPARSPRISLPALPSVSKNSAPQVSPQPPRSSAKAHTGPQISAVLSHRSNEHVSKSAVSLSWIIDTFTSSEHPEIIRENLDSHRIVSRIIKPKTKDTGCSYVEWMRERGQLDSVSNGRGFWFCSHTWGLSFVDMLEQLKHFFDDQGIAYSAAFVWVDILAMSQWKSEGLTFNALLKTLREVVEDAQSILMVVDEKGVILTRIWCLYEAWQSCRKKKQGSLRLLTYRISIDNLESLFLDLNVAKAQAQEKSDLEAILEDIKKDVGIHKMTIQLKEALVASAAEAVPPEIEPWTQETGELLYRAARFYNGYDKIPEAQALMERNLQGCERALGRNHPYTIDTVMRMGVLYQSQGKRQLAEPLLQRALEWRTNELGSDHLETMKAQHALGSFYCVPFGFREEGLGLLKSCLAGREKVLGRLHLDTLAVLESLSTAKQWVAMRTFQCDLRDSETSFRDLLSRSEQAYCPGNSLSEFRLLSSLIALVSNLQTQGKKGDQGKFVESEALLERACDLLDGMDDNPRALNLIASLISGLETQGLKERAIEMRRRAVNANSTCYGPTHVLTLKAISKLAESLMGAFEEDEAVDLYISLLEITRDTFGSEHSRSTEAAGELAHCYEHFMRYSEAEPLRRMLLESSERETGRDSSLSMANRQFLNNNLRAQREIFGD